MLNKTVNLAPLHTLQKAGQHAECVAAINDVLSGTAANSTLLLLRANSLLQLDRSDEARQDLHAATGLPCHNHKQDERNVLQLMQVLLKRQDHQTIVGSLPSVMHWLGASASLQVIQGRALEKLGRPAEAEASYAAALQLDAGYSAACLHLARLIGRNRLRLPESIALLQQHLALTVVQLKADLQTTLGRQLLATGQHTEAVRIFEQTIADHPQNTEAHLGLISGLEATQPAKIVIQALDSAEAALGVNDALTAARCKALCILEQHETASALLENLLSQGTVDADLVHKLAQTAKRQKQLRAALAYLALGLKCQPTNAKLLIAAARINAQLGDHETAHQQATQVEKLAFDDSDTLQNLQKLKAVLKSRKPDGTENTEATALVTTVIPPAARTPEILISISDLNPHKQLGREPTSRGTKKQPSGLSRLLKKLF